MKAFKSIQIIILLISLFVTAPVWAAMAPDQLVEKSIQDVMAIIKQDKAIQSGDKNKIYTLVNEKILPHFDFNRMTRLAMGKNWKKATPAQQSELVEAFRTLLVRTYSNALSSYQDEVVEVTPLTNLGNSTDSTVKTTVIQGGGKAPVAIDYSMHKTGSGWQVYDVTVAGVSLVTNYRGTFNSQIRKKGVDGLIEALNKKNQSLQNK